MIPESKLEDHKRVILWTGDVKKVIPNASHRECHLLAIARVKRDFTEMGRLLDVILLRETR